MGKSLLINGEIIFFIADVSVSYLQCLVVCLKSLWWIPLQTDHLQLQMEASPGLVLCWGKVKEKETREIFREQI